MFGTGELGPLAAIATMASLFFSKVVVKHCHLPGNYLCHLQKTSLGKIASAVSLLPAPQFSQLYHANKVYASHCSNSVHPG